MHNDNIVIGDSSGAMTWYDKEGVFLKKVEGNSGIVMMTSDWSKTILAVGR